MVGVARREERGEPVETREVILVAVVPSGRRRFDNAVYKVQGTDGPRNRGIPTEVRSSKMWWGAISECGGW